MGRERDPQWLADVTAPGPNGIVFSFVALEPAVTASLASIMEDDTQASLFTPGCGAYAGYYNGSFANMAAVRAYAATQGARSFSYTTDGNAGADALDVEPGDAVPGDFPAFWRSRGGKGVHVYASASEMPQVHAAASAAGIARSSYKAITAHWIGRHICGPGTCGYAQADATQFTDSYNGRSLDATEVSATFWGAASPPPSPWPLMQGSTGPDVLAVQRDLNSWATAGVISVNPLLAEDGIFGAKTAAAVALAQEFLGQQASGQVSQALFAQLQGTIPAKPVPPAYPVPAAVLVTASAQVHVTWAVGSPVSPHWRVQVAADAGGKPGTILAGGSVTVTVNSATIAVPHPGKYWARVQAAGNSPFTAWKAVTA